MKTKIRKATSVLLSLVCLTAALSPASAVNVAEDTPQEVIEPRYTGLVQLLTSLDISPSGTASCMGKATIRSGYTGDLTVILQRSTDGRNWNNVATWTASGSGSVVISRSITVVSGYQYQVVSSIDISTNSGSFVEDSEIASRVVEY